MCKKIGIVALAVVAGIFLLRSTNLGSYTSTMIGKLKHSASNQVPLEFELDRVRNEVSQLVPDMKSHISAIATEEVAVENLRQDVKTTRAQLDKQKENILTMRKDLETAGNGTKTIVYSDREFTVSRVRERLTRDWDSYKRCEEGLKSKEKLLEAKEESLNLAREQLSSMRAKKEQLEVEVAQLEAEVKNLRLAQTKSNFQLDDTRLARIHASMSSIRDRLRVQVKEQELTGRYASDLDIPVEKKVKTQEVMKEIDDHFGKNTKGDVADNK